MAYDFSWLDGIGIDTAVGLEYTRSEDKYLSALQRYYKGYEQNHKKAVDFYNQKDWENYMIVVHALKSNSKMIGADSLGGAFEKLEMAARNGETSVIEEMHESTFSDYQKLIDALKPIGEKELVKPADEISAERAKEVSEALLLALDDFDDELAMEQLLILMGYPFRLTQQSRLKEVKGLIEDFMYDEAAEIVKEILPEIQ